jgi:hypothetical protein
MADEVESTPVKRGPGRPRKTVAPEPTEVEVPTDSDDPRIGQSVPELWTNVGYDDGREYRCENGVIVEKVRG